MVQLFSEPTSCTLTLFINGEFLTKDSTWLGISMCSVDVAWRGGWLARSLPLGFERISVGGCSLDTSLAPGSFSSIFPYIRNHLLLDL